MNESVFSPIRNFTSSRRARNEIGCPEEQAILNVFGRSSRPRRTTFGFGGRMSELAAIKRRAAVAPTVVRKNRAAFA